MSLFTTLCESSDPIAREVAAIIKIHPAFPYIRTSYLYDEIYLRFKAECDNLKEARLRTMLHITHILDEIAHSLGIMSSDTNTRIPDIIFQDALTNPKWKAYSDLVSAKSKLRRSQRKVIKAKEEKAAMAPAKQLSDIAFSWTASKSSSIDALVEDIKADKKK